MCREVHPFVISYICIEKMLTAGGQRMCFIAIKNYCSGPLRKVAGAFFLSYFYWSIYLQFISIISPKSVV